MGYTTLHSLTIDLHYVLAIVDEWLPTITTVAYGERTMGEALGDHQGEQGPN